MKYPIVLLGATAQGGSVIPIVGSALGDLTAITLLGVTGPACTVEKSANGTTGWTTVTYPATINSGFLRLTRTDETAAATMISVSQPDPTVAGRLPTAGTAGEILSKTTATDYDVQWIARGFVPVGGSVGQILSKTGAGDYATGWIEPPSGGSGGGGAVAAFPLSSPARYATLGFGATSTVNVAQIAILPDQYGMASQIDLPATISASLVSGLTIYDENSVALIDALGTELSYTPIPGGTRIGFAPVWLFPDAQFFLYFSSPVPMPAKASADIPNGSGTITLYNASSGVIPQIVNITLTGPDTPALNSPIGPRGMPLVRVATDKALGKGDVGYTELVVGAGAPTLRVFGADLLWYKLQLVPE